MPPGSPFQTPGRRWIVVASWLDRDRIYFSIHCGSGCVGHYSVSIKDGAYGIFCIGSGQFVWAPNRKLAVAENYGGGGSGPIGLGLVDESSAIKMAPGATPMQPRLCKSVFSGVRRVDDPGEAPRMVSWFPDSRHVLYVNLQDGSARLWDTSTGQRTTLIAGQGGGK